MAASVGDSVYLLWFVRESDIANDDELLIGVYRSEADARSAIDRLKEKPGFAKLPTGFQISRYEVGKDNWTEGFVRE